MSPTIIELEAIRWTLILPHSYSLGRTVAYAKSQGGAWSYLEKAIVVLM